MAMADVAPLKPLRFADSKRLPDLVAPPYDVISKEERDGLARKDAHNVVRLILPDGEGDTKYARAATLLEAWRADGTLVRDEQAAFYRYDQTFSPPGGGPRVTRTGLLGLVRLVPFSDRVVLPHERTLSGPKEDRLKLFRATKTNLSPGFMLYRDPKRALDSAMATGEPVARFIVQAAAEPSPIEHALWKIADHEATHAIQDHLGKGSLLIADGHHRYETALHYSREVDAAGNGGSSRAEHRFFMVFFANEDDPSLLVFPTHRLVRGLLDFSREARGERTGVDLDALARDAAKLLEPVAAKREVALSVETDHDRPVLVRGNRTELEQVLVNLLMNGLQAMSSGGALRVRVRAARPPDDDGASTAPPPCACVEVHDEGSGIAPEVLPKLFDPFFTTKDVGEGTGLGLSVSYGIVSDHGGRIEVASKVGASSVFSVYLPLERPTT